MPRRSAASPGESSDCLRIGNGSWRVAVRWNGRLHLERRRDELAPGAVKLSAGDHATYLEIRSWQNQSPGYWIKTAHKLPAQFGSSDWQPFANHPTDRANT